MFNTQNTVDLLLSLDDVQSRAYSSQASLVSLIKVQEAVFCTKTFVVVRNQENSGDVCNLANQVVDLAQVLIPKGNLGVVLLQVHQKLAGVLSVLVVVQLRESSVDALNLLV